VTRPRVRRELTDERVRTIDRDTKDMLRLGGGGCLAVLAVMAIPIIVYGGIIAVAAWVILSALRAAGVIH